MKFWNFVKNDASGSEQIELRISGDIMDDDDAWIYEWFGIPVASPNAFRKELAQYAGKNITVWIDSYGGSVFAAIGIYNALIEHKKTGGYVTTIGDSKIMSAATIIFMAGDKRKMTPGCMYMTHEPLTSAAGYASDLRKAADVLVIVKESIINIYQITTKLDRDKIASMMEDETYMSAQTAVKEGFATEILYVGEEKEGNPVINFSFKRLDIQNAAHDTVRTFLEVAKKCAEGKKQSTPQNQKEEHKKMDIKTVEDLQKEHPDLCNTLITNAVKTAMAKETERVKELDALDDPQNAAVHDIIADAKATGKVAVDVKNIVDIIKKHTPDKETETPKNAAANFMTDLLTDNKGSGVDNIKSGAGGQGGDERQEMANAASFMAGVINQKNGRNQK